MIPLKINNKHLCEIFEHIDVSGMSDAQIQAYCIDKQMFPTNVEVVSETYSRDAERTADYELENLIIVNRKAKPIFTWRLIRAEYVENLTAFLKYDYNFKDAQDIIIPRKADDILITYRDFIGTRTVNTYLGQTIEGTLVEYEGVQYWENFSLSFPER